MAALHFTMQSSQLPTSAARRNESDKPTFQRLGETTLPSARGVAKPGDRRRSSLDRVMGTAGQGDRGRAQVGLRNLAAMQTSYEPYAQC